MYSEKMEKSILTKKKRFDVAGFFVEQYFFFTNSLIVFGNY